MVRMGAVHFLAQILISLAYADAHQAGKGIQRKGVAQHLKIPAPLGKQKAVARQVIGQNQVQFPGAEHVQQAAEFGLDNFRALSPAVSEMAYLHAAPARADPDHAVLSGPHVAGPADITGTRAEIGLGEIHEFPPFISFTDPHQKVEPAVAHALSRPSVQRQKTNSHWRPIAWHSSSRPPPGQSPRRGRACPPGKTEDNCCPGPPAAGRPAPEPTRRGTAATARERPQRRNRSVAPHPFHGNPHPDIR